MSDEEHSPRNTSEATPPHVDSPEMVNPPSPEDQTVSSSTDEQLPEFADSPDEQRVSSTSDEPNEGAGPSNRSSKAEMHEALTVEASPPIQLSTDAATETENQPDAPSDPTIRLLLEAPPVLIERDEPSQPIEDPVINAELITDKIVHPPIQEVLDVSEAKSVADDKEISQKIAKDTIEQESDEDKSDSNQQFDVDDSSSKSSPENVDFGSDSSSIVSTVHGDEQTSPRSSMEESVDLDSDLPSRISVTIEERSSSVISTLETVGSKKETPPSKPRLNIPVSESGTIETVEIRSELSPSKTNVSTVKASGSAPSSFEKARQVFSPKRKSPTKFQHLSPKRSVLSPEKLQKQSDSQMSTLLEELDIKEGEISGSAVIAPGGTEQESRTQAEETEESSMETQETDLEKYPKSENSKMEESD